MLILASQSKLGKFINKTTCNSFFVKIGEKLYFIREEQRKALVEASRVYGDKKYLHQSSTIDELGCIKFKQIRLKTWTRPDHYPMQKKSWHPWVKYEVYRNDKHRRTMQLNIGLFKLFWKIYDEWVRVYAHISEPNCEILTPNGGRSQKQNRHHRPIDGRSCPSLFTPFHHKNPGFTVTASWLHSWWE